MTQAEALELMHSGANIFLTGEPGAGKTYTLNKFIEEAQEKYKRIAITASTGIAASHLGGTTIHSWSGLGIADAISDAELDRMSYKQQIMERYNRCDILIIDEVSMLHGSRLDMVDRACRWIRQNDRPFGGLQVILVGDMFQLPPVTRGSDETDFAHHSNAWKMAELTPCYLTEQHRQEGFDQLLSILREMRRNGKVLDSSKQILQERLLPAPDDTITKLYTHNVDVDSLNNEKLKALDGPQRTFRMSGKGQDWQIDKLKKNLLCPEKLELKVDAEVMFVANDFEAGFVNGTRGRVTRFDTDGDPVVETTDGKLISVEPHTWRQFNETGERVIAEVSQHPLRLAWAVTIHKSQGMSLDAAEIDLSKAFVPGMGYVALSRVRSFEGLFLTGLGPQALLLDQDIFEFDKALKLGRS